MSNRLIISLLAAAIALAAACNREGSEGDDSGKGRTDICSILTIGQTEYLDSLEYDGKGRVVKVKTFAIEDEEISDLMETVSYSYSDGKIEREVGSFKQVYTLGKDNLITSMSAGGNTTEFTYDSEGHLTKIGNVSYTWKDGNLASDSEGYKYTSSSVENPGYWPVEIPGTDKWLYRKGYFGKLPTRLPSAWGMKDEPNNISHEYTCEYESDGGVLVECDMIAIHTTGSTPSISEYRITINWKKY